MPQGEFRVALERTFQLCSERALGLDNSFQRPPQKPSFNELRVEPGAQCPHRLFVLGNRLFQSTVSHVCLLALESRNRALNGCNTDQPALQRS